MIWVVITFSSSESNVVLCWLPSACFLHFFFHTGACYQVRLLYSKVEGLVDLVEFNAGLQAADAPKKISGVHKRCWRYIPNLSKSTESAPNLTKSTETVPKDEVQASWCISLSYRYWLPDLLYSDIPFWLICSVLELSSIGIVVFRCCLFSSQFFLDVFDALCSIFVHWKQTDFQQCKWKYVVINEKIEHDGFSFLKFFLFLEWWLVLSLLIL